MIDIHHHFISPLLRKFLRNLINSIVSHQLSELHGCGWSQLSKGLFLRRRGRSFRFFRRGRRFLRRLCRLAGYRCGRGCGRILRRVSRASANPCQQDSGGEQSCGISIYFHGFSPYISSFILVFPQTGKIFHKNSAADSFRQYYQNFGRVFETSPCYFASFAAVHSFSLHAAASKN